MSPLRRTLENLNRTVSERPDSVALVALAVSLVLRGIEAAHTYLDPDEAMYFVLSIPDGTRLFQSANKATHPFLYIVLMNWLGKLSEHEFALRSAALAAGTVFPWFLYRWLSLVWNRLAGLMALLLVAFAPNLMTLGAQARGYTLAFLGICACLYFQERAIRESSSRWMMASTMALCLGIVSEYFVSFFAAAAGAVFLFRSWTQPRTRLWLNWAAGQVCGVALYGLLFVTQIRPMLASKVVEGGASLPYLEYSFPRPETSRAFFLAYGTVAQFAFLFGRLSLGILMILPFLVGCRFLWKGHPSTGQPPRRHVIALIGTMFVLSGAGALAHFHPFGNSRHTAFLGIFIVVGIAIALERLLARLPGVLVPAALTLLPVWHVVALEHGHNVPSARHQRERMLTAIEGIRTRVPAGATILMDEETRVLFYYYAGLDGPPRPAVTLSAPDWTFGDYRLVSYRFSYRSLGEIAADLRRLRVDYHVPFDSEIWLIDGGYAPFAPPQAGTEKSAEILEIVRVPPGSARRP